MKRLFNCGWMKHFGSLAAVNETRRRLAIRRVSLLGLAVALVLATATRADVLTGTNGERFVGTVIAETTNTSVFHFPVHNRPLISLGRRPASALPDRTGSSSSPANG